MFKNYVIIALRNMLRNKAYSLINIFGLSLGVACCLLLALYVQDEIGYDKHHHRVEDVYRINTHIKADDDIIVLGATSAPIAFTLRDEVPEVEVATRVVSPPGVSQNLIKYEDNVFYETDGYIADSTLFDVLTYTFIEGNPKKALSEANAVVITDKVAKKLFGNTSALNKTIFISQGGPSADFTITGVIKDETKSHLHANFFVSMTSTGWAEYIRSKEVVDEWAGQNFIPAYLKLRPGHNIEAVEKKINEVLIKHGAEDLKALGFSKTLALEPVKDIYLKSGIQHSPRIQYIYVVVSIAVFVLLLACINFMNLSTAKATKRATEIGLRKVMGAFRSALIRQILGEAMILVLISILFSLILVQASLPLFNSVTGKSISLNTVDSGYFIIALVTITIITGLISGSYPAFYLSSFQPAQVLKGKFNLSGASGRLRQSLVVLQFVISITLVCGMILISRQLAFMQHTDLGFDTQAKIVLPLRTTSAKESYSTLLKELSMNRSVKKVSATEYVPGSYIRSDFPIYPQGGSIDKAPLHRTNWVDYEYSDLMGIKLIAGRNFSPNRSEKVTKVILNRTSANTLGFTPEEAVGQRIFTEWQGQKYEFEVIGIMEDYHQVSLRDKIIPVMFRMPEDIKSFDYMVVSIATSNFNATISDLEKTWKGLVNDTPFEYSFLDENIRKQYDEDRRVSTIITSFTVIAMFISCLGLYGLSTYMAERRFKEIGIRKVMGASVNQIVTLMSGEFIKLVIIAMAISIPLSWYAMNKWLEGFAYRISVDVLVFIYAGVTALFIALLTVSFESFKAASANPINALRSE